MNVHVNGKETVATHYWSMWHSIYRHMSCRIAKKMVMLVIGPLVELQHVVDCGVGCVARVKPCPAKP